MLYIRGDKSYLYLLSKLSSGGQDKHLGGREEKGGKKGGEGGRRGREESEEGRKERREGRRGTEGEVDISIALNTE